MKKNIKNISNINIWLSSFSEYNLVKLKDEVYFYDKNIDTLSLYTGEINKIWAITFIEKYTKNNIARYLNKQMLEKVWYTVVSVDKGYLAIDTSTKKELFFNAEKEYDAEKILENMLRKISGSIVQNIY